MIFTYNSFAQGITEYEGNLSVLITIYFQEKERYENSPHYQDH